MLSAKEQIKDLLRFLSDARYSFTTVTPATHARVIKRAFNPDTATLRDIFGWSRPFKQNCLERQMFENLQKAHLLEAQGENWRSKVRVAGLEERLFVHSAYPTVEEDAVFFGPDTYRLVRAMEAGGPPNPRRIVDIGCGTGAAGIILAGRNPQADVYLLDVNDRALALASVNAEAAGIRNTTCVKSDLLQNLSGQLDLIVSNPPFMVDAAHRTYRDGGGIHGNDIALAILDAALHRLAPGGSCLILTGTPIINGVDVFRSAVEQRMKLASATWRYDELDPDVYGEELENAGYEEADRIAIVTLWITVGGSRQPGMMSGDAASRGLD